MSQTENPQHWQVLGQEQLVEAWPWIRVYKEHVRLPNNVEIPDYYRVEFPGFVSIFPVTPDQQVIMVEQYKHGPATMSLELPAGGLGDHDEDATPLATAKRELLEETGMIAPHWKSLGKYFVDGNRGCGWMYAFLATEVVYQQAPQPEPTELLTVHTVPIADVRELWLHGKIENLACSALIGLALAHLTM